MEPPKTFCLTTRSKSYTTYSETCVKRPLSKKTKIVFQDQLSLNAGQKYCKMSILQYLRPPCSYQLSLRYLFCLFLSGHFTQVLLYMVVQESIKKTILRSIAMSIAAYHRCKRSYYFANSSP